MKDKTFKYLEKMTVEEREKGRLISHAWEIKQPMMAFKLPKEAGMLPTCHVALRRHVCQFKRRAQLMMVRMKKERKKETWEQRNTFRTYFFFWRRLFIKKISNFFHMIHCKELKLKIRAGGLKVFWIKMFHANIS